MRLRFWRRPKRYITLPQPPAGLMAGDVMYLSAPKDATPPPGWTWDDNHGWHKTVTPADPQEVQSELTAAAASGPWEAHLEAKWAADKQSEIARLSEHLDAARPECTRAYCAIFDDWQKIAAERDAALARNAELEREVHIGEEMIEQQRKELKAEEMHADPDADCVVCDHLMIQEVIDERDAARAELDNLRDRVTALADECEKVAPANAEMNAWQRAHAAFARELRAIVRGSDDE